MRLIHRVQHCSVCLCPVPGTAARMLSLSVVIPCKDDADLLLRCLAALETQTLPPLEVVVVDNSSTDDTQGVARRFRARVVTESRPGIPAAASTGYDAATGDLIVRCDADSLPPPNWLERIAATFEADDELVALTGPGDFYGVGRRKSRLLARLYFWPFAVATGAALAHWPLYGSNMAMRRVAWETVRTTVHRQDPEMHDDMDLSLHLGTVGRLRLDPHLRVGVSPRAVRDIGNFDQRFRRGVHTLRSHWPEEAPWRRWPRRLGSRRRRSRRR